MQRSKSIRQIKLHSKFRFIDRGWTKGASKIVPWLNVSGLWLEQAGFHAGNQVEIQVKRNELVIKNVTNRGSVNPSSDGQPPSATI